MHTRVLVATALIVLAAAMTASAQSGHPSFKTVTKDCSGIDWSEEAKATYPTIAEACQGVEVRDGKTYVKFEGKVSKNINRGEQLAIKFKDGGEMTVTPPPEMVLYIAGRKTPVSALKRGDELSFYVPEDRFTAQFRDEQTAQVTSAPILRIVHTTTDYTAQNLPATASELPWLAVSGALLLVLGAGITLRRRRSH
jgi:LPXTG-motif cell wall-anchored protein